jgi:hypothetical protein
MYGIGAVILLWIGFITVKSAIYVIQAIFYIIYASFLGFFGYRIINNEGRTEKIKSGLDRYSKFKNSNSINIFKDIVSIRNIKELRKFQEEIKRRLNEVVT